MPELYPGKASGGINGCNEGTLTEKSFIWHSQVLLIKGQWIIS